MLILEWSPNSEVVDACYTGDYRDILKLVRMSRVLLISPRHVYNIWFVRCEKQAAVVTSLHEKEASSG